MIHMAHKRFEKKRRGLGVPLAKIIKEMSEWFEFPNNIAAHLACRNGYDREGAEAGRQLLEEAEAELSNK